MAKNVSGKISETISHLGTRWKGADRKILRPVFPILSQGRPVALAHIVEKTGSEPDVVYQALTAARADLNDSDQVIELSGFMLDPTMHRVQLDSGIIMFSCCALFSHTLPHLTGKSVIVESVDPVSREIVRLSISTSGLQSVQPKQAIATLVVTDEEGVLGDVRSHLCSHVFHFSSLESAQHFVSENPRRFIVDIETLNEAGKHLYSQIWS